MQPIVLISSYPPRLCGIATFVEEAREFVQAALADRETHVICHPDGRGENVHPILDPTQPNWDEVVAREVKALNPYAVHIQHEYGLYAPPHENGHDGAVNGNRKFLDLLHRIRDYPTIVEPHTVHGRTRESEERFLRELTDTCSILLLKCDYQKWRMGWNFRSCGWPMPRGAAGQADSRGPDGPDQARTRAVAPDRGAAGGAGRMDSVE
jgi:1,2-diacylglycerol 3-alpha-glucosyltransferase